MIELWVARSRTKFPLSGVIQHPTLIEIRVFELNTKMFQNDLKLKVLFTHKEKHIDIFWVALHDSKWRFSHSTNFCPFIGLNGR